MIVMPPRGRWILGVAVIISAVLALLGAVMYPGSAEGLQNIVVYEIALFVGMFIILGLAYKRGYTEPDVSVG